MIYVRKPPQNRHTYDCIPAYIIILYTRRGRLHTHIYIYIRLGIYHTQILYFIIIVLYIPIHIICRRKGQNRQGIFDYMTWNPRRACACVSGSYIVPYNSHIKGVRGISQLLLGLGPIGCLHALSVRAEHALLRRCRVLARGRCSPCFSANYVI